MIDKTNGQLREELQDAIAKVRHQIDVQSVSNHYLGSEEITAEALSELHAELAQLESALTDLN